MTGYTKLFGSIITSTIWCEDDITRLVWITMLALKNKEDIVEGSVPGLAAMARVPIEECAAALDKLGKPDLYSRTKEHEGRRIKEVDGGWLIINGDKYRKKMNSDERREYFRLKQEEHRARKKNVKECQRMSKPVKDTLLSSTQSEAEAEAEAESEAEAKAKAEAKNRERKSSVKTSASVAGKNLSLSLSEEVDFVDQEENGDGLRIKKNGPRCHLNGSSAIVYPPDYKNALELKFGELDEICVRVIRAAGFTPRPLSSVELSAFMDSRQLLADEPTLERILANAKAWVAEQGWRNTKVAIKALANGLGAIADMSSDPPRGLSKEDF